MLPQDEDPELREQASLWRLTERRLVRLRPEARWTGTPIETREPKWGFKGAPGKQTAEQGVGRYATTVCLPPPWWADPA